MNTKQSGDMGENLVCGYLTDKGYIITARNYHSRFGEIDIVAENNEYILFIEVKTRSYNALFRPCEAVDVSKQQKIRMTALEYLSNNFTGELQPRFDVAEILMSRTGMEKSKINYIENAFDAII